MYTKKDVVNTIFRLAKRRYGVMRQMNKNDTFESLHFDHLDQMYLVMGSEEIYKIEISNEEADTLHSLRDLVNLVITKLRDAGQLELPVKKDEVAETATNQESVEQKKDNSEETDEQVNEKAEESNTDTESNPEV